MFPEQNVHFGRGPKAVDVIWVAIESSSCQYAWIDRVVRSWGRGSYTHENLGLKEFSHWRGVLLNIVWVVVEGTVFFACKKGVRILNHLRVQSIEHVVRHHIVDND